MSVELKKLQRIQSTAARLVSRVKRTEHNTPILRDLHCFSIRERISFKLLLITFKGLHGCAPSYILDVSVRHQPIIVYP